QHVRRQGAAQVGAEGAVFSVLIAKERWGLKERHGGNNSVECTKMAPLPAVPRPVPPRRRRAAVPGAALAWLCVGLCLGAVGCSTRKVAYNLAEPILRRVLDQALDLRPEQERILAPRLRELLRWHRESELPLYAE